LSKVGELLDKADEEDVVQAGGANQDDPRYDLHDDRVWSTVRLTLCFAAGSGALSMSTNEEDDLKVIMSATKRKHTESNSINHNTRRGGGSRRRRRQRQQVIATLMQPRSTTPYHSAKNSPNV
jgi:hypothetical protein